MEYAHKVQSVRAMLCGVRSQGTVSESNVMWSTTLSGSQGTVSESNVMWSTRTRYSQ